MLGWATPRTPRYNDGCTHGWNTPRTPRSGDGNTPRTPQYGEAISRLAPRNGEGGAHRRFRSDEGPAYGEPMAKKKPFGNCASRNVEEMCQKNYSTIKIVNGPPNKNMQDGELDQERLFAENEQLKKKVKFLESALNKYPPRPEENNENRPPANSHHISPGTDPQSTVEIMKELDESRKKIGLMDFQLQKTQSVNKQFAQKIKSLKARLVKETGINNDLGCQKNYLEKELIAARAALSKPVDSLKKELEKANTEIQTIKMVNRSLEREIEKLKKELTQAHVVIADQDTNIKTLQTEMEFATIKDKQRRNKSEASTNTDDYVDFDKEEEIDNLTETITDLESKNVQLKDAFEIAIQKLRSKELKNLDKSESPREKESLLKEHEELEDEFEVVCNEKERLQKSHVKLKDNYKCVLHELLEAHEFIYNFEQGFIMRQESRNGPTFNNNNFKRGHSNPHHENFIPRRNIKYFNHS